MGGILSVVNSLDLTGSQATNHAIDAQTAASNQSNATLKSIYDSQRQDLQPWREAGSAALGKLQDNNFMNNWQQNDPGYQFRLDEGNKAINAAAAARGLSNSGSTLKALTKYGQDYSSNEYNNAYNRQYSRLSSLAGIGQNANQQTSQAAGVYGQSLSNNQIGLGNSIASADIAQANRISQMFGQGITAGALAFSDERLKENIEKIDPLELQEMRKELKAYKFSYKSKEHGSGDWIGVMAQDLEKSKLGKTLVFTDNNGHKQLHIQKILSLFLATIAEG